MVADGNVGTMEISKMISQRACRFAFPVFVCVGLGVAQAESPAPLERRPTVAVPRGRPAPRPSAEFSKWQPGPARAAVPDPLRGTPAIKPETTGTDATSILDKLLPGRSDAPSDWYAPVEPLHQPCEPRALAPCVPPPPCDPSMPPNPYDLVGLAGSPSCGPIYRGPCAPRTGTPHQGMFAWYHRMHDRFFDHFYRWK